MRMLRFAWVLAPLLLIPAGASAGDPFQEIPVSWSRSRAAAGPSEGTCHIPPGPFTPQSWDPLCLPGSFENVCAQLDPSSRARVKRILAGGEAFEKRIDELLVSVTREQKALLAKEGKTPANTRDYFKILWPKVHRKVQEQATRDSREKVAFHVRKALDAFRAVVRKSRILASDEKNALDQALLNCFVKPPELEYLTKPGRDAEVVRSFGGFLPEDVEENSDLMVKGLTDVCQLELSPTSWLECAEGTPECYDILFHELGHGMNSCAATSTSLVAAWSEKQMRDSQAGPLKTLGSWLNGQYLNAEKLARLAQVSVSAKSLASSLERSVSCLSVTAQPRDGVLNTCPGAEDIPLEKRSRCSFGEAIGYPSQWYEAEADLWGASAFADWLETEFTAPEARNAAARAAIASWCEVGFHDENPGQVQRALDRRLYEFAKFLGEDLDQVRSARIVHKPCQQETRVSAGPPWNNPHQSWSDRVNRNLLQNTDLRRALGCAAASETNVAATCSPLTGLQLAVPSR